MVKINHMDTNNRRIIEKKGSITVFEYDHDLSVKPDTAMHSYYAAKMNVRKRQVMFELNGKNSVIIQAGTMQWMAGNVTAGTNIKGVGDLAKKFVGSKVTGESAVKPKYSGEGYLMLEPTYRHLLVEDISAWDGMVIEDGLFLGCESTVDLKTVARKSLSSTVIGGEGLFNTCLSGTGYAVLESNVPREELIEVILNNDVLKVDGNFAIAWSRSLDFTVERTTKTLIGSAASGEGLVNVYRGTGKVWMAPL